MGLLDSGWEDPQIPKPPDPFPNNGGLPGSGVGSMTGPTNTGVPTTNNQTLQTPAVLPFASQTPPVTPPTAPATTPTTVAPPTAPTPPPTASAPSNLSGFDSQLKTMIGKVQAAGTMADKAAAKDELSRVLFAQLTAAGHKTAWDGDTLMVDGRPYTVAGLATNSGSVGAGIPWATGSDHPSYNPPGYHWDADMAAFLPGDAPGGDQTQTTGTVKSATPGVPDRPTDLAQALQMANQIAYGGNAKHTDVGYWQRLWAQDPDYAWRRMLGEQAGSGDAATSGPFAGGGGGMGGGFGGTGGLGQSFGGSSAMMQALMTSLGQPLQTQTLAGIKSASGIPNPDLPADLANWRPPTETYYKPGEITFDDIPNFTRESMMKEMEGDPTSMASDSLINRILKNPESMGQATTDTMKAQMKDQLAEQQRQEEEDMKAFGASSGIADSGWLGSQRLASRRGRDMAIAKGNQDVDIKAAAQNQQDRLAAAGVGMQRQGLHQGAVQTATSAALQRSAAMGDRMQLRESVQQEAARLRISQDQVMSNFIMEKERNMIQRYGIDLGGAIDVEKLNKMDSQHREDLMAKMAELEQTLGLEREKMSQSDRQFGANLTFDYDKLNSDNWQKDQDRTTGLFNPK